MEQTHVPIKFEGEIDWLHQPDDDPEWTYAVNRMRAWVCMGQAYAITGDEKYPTAFVRQLTHWVRTIKRADPAAAHAWRTIEAGMRMEYWLKAWQYFKTASQVTAEVEEIFYASMTEHAEYIMTVWNSFNLMSNWGVLANHGLFLAGYMLPQTARTREYTTESLSRLSDAIDMQVYHDGVHWEQSPMYHNEVMRSFLDVILAARAHGIEVPQNILGKTKAMAYASLYGMKPNGHELMMGDSDDVDQRDMLSIAAYVFNDGMLKCGGYPKMDFDTIWAMGFYHHASLKLLDAGHTATLQYEKLPTIQPRSTAHGLTASGNFFSRTAWDENATFVHFTCGTLGAGHGHADKLHFDLFSRGEDILVDPGRYTYVSKPDRYWYKLPQAHNTITVDGTDLYHCVDSWESKNLARAVGQKFVSRNGYVYMEGGHLGYMKQGVYVCRRMIHIKPDILLICDTFYGSEGQERTYRQHFQWNNGGKVTGSGNEWQYLSGKNSAKLLLCAEHNITTKLQPGRISRHYNLQEETMQLETQIAAKGFASVFTAIGLSNPGEEEYFAIEKHDVHSNFKKIIFSPQEIEAVTITKGNEKYTAIFAHTEYACPTDTFTANGCVGFGHVVVFDHGDVKLKGTVLAY